MTEPKARFVLTADDQTSRAFASAQRGLRSFQSSVSLARSALAGFGLVASARIFTHFIADSVKVAKLTEDQRKAVDNAAASWRALGLAAKQAVGEHAAASASYWGAVADSVRQSFFPGSFTKSLDDLKAELDQLMHRTLPTQMSERLHVDFLERLVGMDEAEWSRRMAKTLADIAELRRQIAAWETALSNDKAMREAMAGVRRIGDVYDRFGHIRGALDGKTLQRPDIKMDFLDEFEEIVVEARRISEDELLKPFDFAAAMKMFEPIKEEASIAAEFIGDSLRSSFTDFLVDGEFRFKDFLKRIAAEVAASAIFGTLASTFPAGGFLSKLFGGSRASGGTAREGMVYRVHPGEAFFTPGMDGHVGKAGSGDNVTINVDARGATDPAAVEAAAYRGGMAGYQAAREYTDARFRALSRPSIA